ncbi:MAG: hypothetical protein JRM73_01115 [Nitrososphaerota archaeon]|nr:hypothetical protein [Nitrososphaerota archaeon]
MSTRVTSALLIAVILMTTVAMGLTFDAGGLGGGGSAGGVAKSQSSESSTGNVPHLLVKAYSSAGNGSFPTTGAQNQPFLSPLTGLRFTLTATEVSLSRLGRPLTYFAFTNSSGEAEIAVAAGNYSIQATSAKFNLTRAISFTGHLTTELDLVVSPVYTGVTSLTVVNADQTSQVEASSTIYVQVPGSFFYNRYSLYQITGVGPVTYVESSGGCFAGICETGIATISRVVTINATVTGHYGAPGGTIVVMAPSGAYSQFPVSDIRMLQYVANSTVRYLVS